MTNMIHLSHHRRPLIFHPNGIENWWRSDEWKTMIDFKFTAYLKQCIKLVFVSIDLLPLDNQICHLICVCIELKSVQGSCDKN